MRNKFKVLVVDDERTIADTLAVILQQHGAETHVAYSGQQAVECAETIQPDILLTDVMMPGKNGIEVAENIGGKFPNCEILLFSGSPAAAEMLLQARQRGQNWEILNKPIHPSDLLKKLDRMAVGDKAS
ncbi:MAG TPA: response regulator [Candidatus Angelobacter sp.]|nr:response regulator [Candidatus Angelobacter sp.]